MKNEIQRKLSVKENAFSSTKFSDFMFLKENHRLEVQTVVQPLMKKTKKHVSSSSQNCISRDQVRFDSIDTCSFLQNQFIQGVRSNFKKIREHNSKIEEKLQNLHGNQIKSHTLPSPILTHSINPTRQETNLTSTQSSRKSIFTNQYRTSNHPFLIVNY